MIEMNTNYPIDEDPEEDDLDFDLEEAEYILDDSEEESFYRSLDEY